METNKATPIEKRQEMHIQFSLPDEQDKMDAMLDGYRLREIILGIDAYLSIFSPTARIKAGYLRNLLHKEIKDFGIKSIKLMTDEEVNRDELLPPQNDEPLLL